VVSYSPSFDEFSTTTSPNLCSHVLAAVFAAQLKRENYSDFPAGFRNPNKRREQLEKSTTPRYPRFSGVSLLAKFQPVYTWADVLQCMSTSPKDFMPAGIGEKKPKDIKVFDIGDQGQKKKKHKKADAAPVAAAGGRKRAAFAAPVMAAVPAGGADAAGAVAQQPPAKRRKKITRSARAAVAVPADNDNDDDPAPPPPPIVAPARSLSVRAKDFDSIAQSAAANPAAGRTPRDRRKRTLLDL
jgi:hypothetical protein